MSRIGNKPIAIPSGVEVSVEQSRQMIAALKEAGAAPKYDEYAGVGHNSWDRAYGTPELYGWLLQQRLK